ncbi:MAG: geranylgeranyl reductase family protein [Planctomycetes bacterium]|nr:geranylgeranyl reductase family protein [Planctomycetota bacterium]
MLVKKTDILVIGAGPAGSTVARILSDTGREVCLIDKAAFPRHKTCGGGVPPRTRALLGIDYRHLVKSTVDSITLLGGWRGRLEISDSKMAEIVDRSEFDNYLVEKAIAAGTRFEEEASLEAIQYENQHWIVETKRGEIKAKHICVADGARSKTARLLGEPCPPLGFALEGYLPRDAVNSKPDSNTAFFEFTCIKNGYGWAFPRGEEYAVGVGIRNCEAAMLRQSLKRLCSRKGLSKNHNSGLPNQPQRVKGAHLPFFSGARAWYAKDNLYFLGDAAGLVDPLTGEGLFLAVRSGIFAAEAIANGGAEAYHNLIQREIIPELEIASDFARKAELIPRWLKGFLLGRKRLQGFALLFVDLLKGELTYRQLYAKTH